MANVLYLISGMIGVIAAMVILVERYAPNAGASPEFNQLSDNVKKWHARGKIYNIDERKVFAIVEGSGPETVILIHGFPASSYDYHRAVDLLSKNYRVVVFDFIGFGFSEKPIEGFVYSMMDQAEIALKLWQHLGIREAHVVSHDMGDSVLTEILTRYESNMLPDHFKNFFKSVTFTNGGMVFEHANLRISQSALRHPSIGAFINSVMLKLPLGLREHFNRQQLRSIWSPTYDNEKLRDQDIAEMLQLLQYNGGDHILYKTISYLGDRLRFESRWLKSLSKLKVPVKLLWGDSDAVAPMLIPEHLTKLVMNKEFFRGLQTLKGTGHFLMLENPPAYASALQDIFKSAH